MDFEPTYKELKKKMWERKFSQSKKHFEPTYKELKKLRLYRKRGKRILISSLPIRN